MKIDAIDPLKRDHLIVVIVNDDPVLAERIKTSFEERKYKCQMVRLDNPSENKHLFRDLKNDFMRFFVGVGTAQVFIMSYPIRNKNDLHWIKNRLEKVKWKNPYVIPVNIEFDTDFDTKNLAVLRDFVELP